ncbi:MAG: hypothetical protein QM564_04015 [Bergeyella sp.]
MDLHNIFLQAHRGFAYLALLIIALFIIALIITLAGNSGKISKFLRKTTLFTMILFHVQFLFGIIMLFMTSNFMNIIKEIGMGGLMKNADLRFSYIEHPFSMLIAAVLMTIINKKVKTSERLSVGILILSVIALAFVGYAFPFAKLFG